MTTRRFLGYSKPLLVLEEGQLHTIPPSSRNGFLQRWIPRNGQYFWKLRSVELLARAVGKPRSGVGQPESWTGRTWEILKVLFDDLAERHKQRGSELVLVLLPSRSSPFDATEAYWRLRIEEYARRSGVCFIDLVKEVAALTRDEASSLFNEPPLGHFSEDGNLWVARRLAMRLRSVLSGDEEPDDVGRGHADSCGPQGAKTASRARRWPRSLSGEPLKELASLQP